MTEYQLLIAEPAEAEIDAVFQYLLLRSPEAAEQFREGIAHAIRSLSQMPRRCALAPENGLFTHDVRQLIYPHGRTQYRILFIIFDPENEERGLVRILRVRHGAQVSLDSLASQARDQEEDP